jgi:hypothetical protein
VAAMAAATEPEAIMAAAVKTIAALRSALKFQRSGAARARRRLGWLHNFG